MVQTCLFVSCVLVALLAVPSSAYPSPSNYIRDDGSYEPEEIGNMLERLENLIQMERKIESYKDDISRNGKFHRNIEMLNEIMGPHDKRGLDLGLSRGYSGALHANHLVGMAAANYAGGPGRRRRDAAAATAH